MTDVQAEPGGIMTVAVRHFWCVLPGDSETSQAYVYYKFDDHLRVLGSELGRDFARARARAETLKLYTHAEAMQDEQRTAAVKTWNGTRFVPVEPAR